MSYFFTLTGDEIPNKDEIHLEPCRLTEIYEEYVEAKGFSGEAVVSATVFGLIWKNCFSHVKVREFKAVTGKCGTCAILSQARRKYRDKETRYDYC
jgi:hypothetical protein